MQEIRNMCREIDLLSPSVDDDGRRPDNAEYPWPAIVDTVPVVCAPCEWSFPVQNRLYTPLGKLMLKSAAAILDKLASR